MTERGCGGSQAAMQGDEPHGRELHLEVPSGEGVKRISKEAMKEPSSERS